VIYQLRQTESAALAPLSPKQRQKLAAMARFAYEEVGPDATFDDWRRAECLQVAGKPGLTKCVNGDYNPLKAHFLALSGNAAGSMRADLRGATEGRRQALFQLHKACTEARDVMPEAMKYARGFVKNKRGITLEDADDKTLWHAVYTVRRKAQKERAKKKTGGAMAAGDILNSLLGGSASGPALTQSPKPRHVKGPF
jgi:hypothetical protein